MTELMRRISNCVVTRVGNQIHVDQADDLIEVSNELLGQIDQGDWATYSDGLFTIHGIDGDVAYRLSEDQVGRTYPDTQLMERVS